MRYAGVVGILLLIACGRDDNDHELLLVLHSGERVKLTWYVFGDGAHVPADRPLYDAARDEPCGLEVWTGDEAYCTPSHNDEVYPAAYDSSTCVNELYRFDESNRPRYRPSYVDGVLDRLRYYEAVTVTQYWSKDSGYCEGPILSTGTTFYRPGEELPRNELARMSFRVPGGASRFEVMAITSDDGLSLPYGIHDSELGFDCALVADGPNAATCDAPDARWLRYRDGDCTDAMLPIAPGEAVPAYISERYQSIECARRQFTVGEPTDDVARYGIGLDGCVAMEAAPGATFYRLEARRPGRLVRRRAAVGGLRLEAIEIQADDGAVSVDGFFDTELHDECRLVSPIDQPEVARCVPAEYGYVHAYYRDAECRMPVNLANFYPESPIASCASDSMPALAHDGDDAFRRILWLETDPYFFISESNACVGGPSDDLRWKPIVYHLGDSYDPDRFPIGNIVRDS